MRRSVDVSRSKDQMPLTPKQFQDYAFCLPLVYAVIDSLGACLIKYCNIHLEYLSLKSHWPPIQSNRKTSSTTTSSHHTTLSGQVKHSNPALLWILEPLLGYARVVAAFLVNIVSLHSLRHFRHFRKVVAGHFLILNTHSPPTCFLCFS